MLMDVYKVNFFGLKLVNVWVYAYFIYLYILRVGGWKVCEPLC